MAQGYRRCTVRVRIDFHCISGPSCLKAMQQSKLPKIQVLEQTKSAMDLASASLDCRAENVWIEAIVIAELKFGDVHRHILSADLVERANDAAFEDRPEAFDGLGMDGT